MMDTTITHDSTTTTVHDGTTLDATALEVDNCTVTHYAVRLGRDQLRLAHTGCSDQVVSTRLTSFMQRFCFCIVCLYNFYFLLHYYVSRMWIVDFLLSGV